MERTYIKNGIAVVAICMSASCIKRAPELKLEDLNFSKNLCSPTVSREGVYVFSFVASDGEFVDWVLSSDCYYMIMKRERTEAATLKKLMIEEIKSKKVVVIMEGFTTSSRDHIVYHLELSCHRRSEGVVKVTLNASRIDLEQKPQ